MEARLSAVQKRLLLLLLTSLLVAILARPQPDNGRYTASLDELASFQKSFGRSEAERSLRAQGEAQSQLSLQAVEASEARGRGPRLKLAPNVPPVRPLSSVRLATLADIEAHAQPGATLAVALPEAEALGAALAWRLSRTQKNGPFTLTDLQLFEAAVGAEDVALETQVGELRLASLAARAAVDDATRRVAAAERRVQKRERRKSRSLEKMRLGLDAAQQVLFEKSADHAKAQQAYDSAARSAERTFEAAFAGGAPRSPDGGRAGLPGFAVARVTLEVAGRRSTLDIPVRLTQHTVPLAPLPGAQFVATRALGLWDELKDLGPEAATLAIGGHLNWHFNHVELLGLKLSGSKLLQLLPCVLPVLLGVLLMRMRRAESSYSPFSTRVPDSLPRVGLKNRFLEFVAVVLMPLVAVASATASLLLIDQPPVLPALTAVVVLPLGALVFAKLSDLRDQTVSIVKSHSFPPPAA